MRSWSFFFEWNSKYAVVATLIFFALVEVRRDAALNLVRPHAESDVVGRAGLIPSGRRVEAVAGDEVGARRVPAEIQRHDIDIAEAPVGLIDV